MYYIFKKYIYNYSTKYVLLFINILYFSGGEDYLTFTGTTVNIGQAMDPKSGQFVTPEPGLYLFLITCCTFDMKKCLVSIRKNGKDVANLFDQDGDTNKVFFKSIYIHEYNIIVFSSQKGDITIRFWFLQRHQMS